MNCRHKRIESLLAQFEPLLGGDFGRYRNHVYRVFLNCRLQDNDAENEDKYAIAAVFHDIGIWTDRTIDYLHPSIRQVEFFLLKTGKPEWISEISAMIYWHHKISTYSGDFRQTVETFRRADWTDVSFGLIRFGADRHAISRYRKMLPYYGFHRFLIRKVVTNFFRHPLNPLPMFTS